MFIQRWPGKEWFKIDSFKTIAAIAIALFCLCAPRTLGQHVAQNADAMPANADTILTAQLDVPGSSLIESSIQPEAMHMYLQAARELHSGKAAAAEKHALRAVKMDTNFADADALAATAALTQRQFSRAVLEAESAVHIDANDEKAWVILATADNYLARNADAIEALHHVQQEERTTWQVAYQWARAEAGRNDAAKTLEWANRAALTAPSGFAPLHLLRSSALLAAGETAQAGDELETYLQLLNQGSPVRTELEYELRRIRTLPRYSAGAEYNALRN